MIGGDSACPTELPLRFAMVLYYLLRNYRSKGDATAAGAKELRAVAPKSVEKNVVRISAEQYIFVFQELEKYCDQIVHGFLLLNK